MINKINMINCATYDENGASIEECKKSITYMVRTEVENRPLAII